MNLIKYFGLLFLGSVLFIGFMTCVLLHLIFYKKKDWIG